MLKIGEFETGLARLFCNGFDEKVGLIFDFYDFNEDGYVTGEDIKAMLSHVPLTQVLDSHSATTPKEGKFTKSGGGLYAR
ncbi:MAG: hypothetical protein P4M11_12105 [Candidatus Pacebacteria bacterium]|nr:hypothetical protein [Candidatus Paceibacterota bacterium]